MRQPKREQRIPMATLGRAAQVLRVLAHPHRLKMVEMLMDKPISVGELAEAIQLAPAAVSQHLNNMRAHGIVDRQRDGRHVRYAVINPNAVQLIRCLRQYGDGCGT